MFLNSLKWSGKFRKKVFFCCFYRISFLAYNCLQKIDGSFFVGRKIPYY